MYAIRSYYVRVALFHGPGQGEVGEVAATGELETQRAAAHREICAGLEHQRVAQQPGLELAAQAAVVP